MRCPEIKKPPPHPQTDYSNDLVLFGYLSGGKSHFSVKKLNQIDGKKQISASQFIDLLKDKIVPWRLDECGFRKMSTVNTWETYKNDYMEVHVGKGVWMTISGAYKEREAVKTMTDVITLIKLLG